MISTQHHYPSAHIDQALLASLPLFAHVPPDNLELVVREHTLYFYHDGDSIMHQGDQADGLFILLHGQARVLTDGIFLVARKPYDVLGELAYINQAVRNATVIAQGAVQALVLCSPPMRWDAGSRTLVYFLFITRSSTSNLSRSHCK